VRIGSADRRPASPQRPGRPRTENPPAGFATEAAAVAKREPGSVSN